MKKKSGIRNIRNILLSATAALTLNSCALLNDTEITRRAVNGIENGMTKEEVMAVMKEKPDYRSFEGNRETWEYRCLNGGVLKEVKVDHVVIGFTDGRVSDMHSYAETLPHSPETNVTVNN